MTYKEIAEQLNKKYNTDIFVEDYDRDCGESTMIFITAKSKLGKDFSVEVNPATLKIGSVVINGLTVEDIKILSNTESNYFEKIQTLSLELAKEKENTDYWRNKDRENNAVKEFAQDTILKAIEG